jgi:ABC-type multidrug transport system ATPase subunit
MPSCKVSYSDKNDVPHTIVFSTRSLAEAYAKCIKNAILEDCELIVNTRITKLGSAYEEENKRYIAKTGVKYAATETSEEYVHTLIGSSLLGFENNVEVSNQCAFCKRLCGQAFACYNCRRFKHNAT